MTTSWTVKEGEGPLSAAKENYLEPTRRDGNRGDVSESDPLQEFRKFCGTARFDSAAWSRTLANLGTPL